MLHRSPPKRRQTRALPRPVIKQDKPKPVIELASRLVFSEDEKRELIMAHADARKGREQGMGLGHYIAIVAGCLLVVGGWWLTLERNILYLSPPQDESFSAIAKDRLRGAQAHWAEPVIDNRPAQSLIEQNLINAKQDLGQEAVKDALMKSTATRLMSATATRVTPLAPSEPTP